MNATTTTMVNREPHRTCERTGRNPGPASPIIDPPSSTIAMAVLWLTLLVASTRSAQAQGGAPIWTNRYAGPGNNTDYAIAVAVDASGNVIVTGASIGSGSAEDYATIKYSNDGVPIWTNRFSGPGNNIDLPTGVVVDGSGHVFVTGSSRTNGDFAWASSDYVTVKYSSGGVPLWTNRYNGPANDYDQPYGIGVDQSGSVILTGHSTGIGSGNDYATIKYSNDGVPLWTNRYNGPANDGDGAHDIGVDGSGNVFVTGTSAGSGGNNYSDYATIAYSGAGVPLWTNRYDGIGNWYDTARAVAVDDSGNVVVTGSSMASDGINDYATLAYSGAGVPLWTNRYNGAALNVDDDAYAVAVDGSGNVFVTGSSIGSFTRDYLTVAYSRAGMELWTGRHNGPGFSHDYPSAVVVDDGGNVFVAGTRSSSPYYATIAYSPDGSTLWLKGYNGRHSPAIALDGSGNVFVTGDSSGSLGSEDFITIKYASAIPLGFNRITGKLLPAGDVSLSFVGITGTDYALDRTFDLTLPINWIPQETNNAGASGVLVFTNTPNPNTNNYWRIRSAP